MRSIAHKLHRFAALDRERRSHLLATLVDALFVRLSIRTRGYARTREALDRWTPDSPPKLSPAEESRIVELGSWAVRTTGEQFAGATCLVRSLTLWWRLARRGIESEIRFGVQRDDADLEAHAWLEWNGQPLTDSDDPRETYARFEGHRT